MELILTIIGSDDVGNAKELEVGLALTNSGLTYRVSKISAKLIWRFMIGFALLKRPPQT